MRTTADLIIKSSCIFTAQTHDLVEGAVIVAGKEIVGVVTSADIQSYLGEGTRVIECGDRLVCPGFNDAHTHFIQNGVMKDASYTLSLEGISGRSEALAEIKRFADAHPDNAWIVGCDLDASAWDEQPTKQMLDEAVPNRPAYFASWDMHVGWMNSRALEAAGYTAEKPDPEGGVICRDKNGNPTGICKEPPANDPVWGLANMAADMDRALGNVIREALSFGVTATGCVWPYGGIPEDDTIRVLREFEAAGKLPLRVSCFLKMEPGLENPRRYARTLASERLRFAGVKQITDGVCEAHTGYLTEPYADDPSTCGEPAIGREDLLAMVEEADACGFSVRLHAIGNGAVKQALDCFEEVRRRHGPKGLRHTIEHIETCCHEDIGRFARLGVMPSMQPIHAVLNVDGYPRLLGEKWRPLMWPTRSLIESGAIVAFGTDAPVWNLNPMEGIYAAVTRRQPWDGLPEDGFVPEQCITLAQAIQAYTYGSACAEGFEDRIGTLETGKLADIVVMDRNLFAIPVEDLREARPLYTIVDGTVVYEAEAPCPQ